MLSVLFALVGVLLVGTASVNEQSRRVIVPINDDGYFVVEGNVSGEPISFTIDTGANDIVIGGKVAAEAIAALPKEVVAITPKVVADTGGGSVETVYVRVKFIRIGEIELRDVRVALAPNVPVHLLGTDFLSRVSFSYSQKTNALILEQRE